jgi:CelD/BcsL family acetyltransferase involved in cellulose biosynthesis/RimJ/RimL family protein N-acetyltransferase
VKPYAQLQPQAAQTRLIEPASHFVINLRVDAAAQEALRDPSFQLSWQRLYERCPWGTLLQSADFCLPWYELYGDLYTPLLVTANDGEGELVGLFTLAIGKADGQLVVAGAQMAEYQVWISEPELGNRFIEAALDALRQRYPDKTLRLLFLPSKAPLEWMTPGRSWAKACHLRTISHPLMAIGDGARFRDSLRKKSNKSRLNRLRQAGEVRLQRLTTAEELDEVLDEIYTLTHFRLAAFHRVDVPRQPDPRQRALYLRLMEAPRLVHATLLRAGKEIVAAHIGVYNREQVLLGILAYSPLAGKHSPGKLHILLLGEELAKEGITTFDLTPGGEYKDNFATHFDTAYVLNIFFNRKRHLRYKTTRMVVDSGKRLMGRAGLSPERVKTIIHRGRHKLARTKLSRLPLKAAQTLKKRLWHTGEMRIYAMDAVEVAQLPNPCVMKRDCLEDLLAYAPTEAWQPSKDEFLRHAAEGLENGAHIYTYAEGGRLLHYGWLIERQTESVLSEVGQTNYLPSGAAVLADYYTHPLARGRGLYQKSLSQMLHDATAIAGTRSIYIGVMADNGPSRHVIEKLGFVYQYSFFRQRRPHATRLWSNAPESARAAQQA